MDNVHLSTTDSVPPATTAVARLEPLAGHRAARCSTAAAPRGATQAEVVLLARSTASTSTCAWARSRRSSPPATAASRVTVYFGQRKGSASTADLREDSLDATVEQACAIARHTEDDAAAGLAERELMAHATCAEFDGWHPWALDADRAIDLALACEQAGRELDPRIANSDGASVGSSDSRWACTPTRTASSVRERSTQHTHRLRADRRAAATTCSATAGTATALARGRPRSRPRRSAAAPPSARLSRLAPRSMPTGECRCCSRPKSRAR